MYNSQRKILVGNLPVRATTNDIRNVFKNFCDILDCEIIIDKTTKKSLGYGYLYVTNSHKLNEILSSQSFYLFGNKIKIQEIADKGIKNNSQNERKKQSHKIFVGGLPPEATKQTLSNFFKKYGEVEYSIVMTDKNTNKPRGFGFVIFKNVSSVKSALNDSWNHFILGKWVECKRANAKGVSIPNKDKEKIFELEGAETNDCSEKDIDTINTDKQLIFQRKTIPFTSKRNPMDNYYNEVYQYTNKYQSLIIQQKMESYYRFKFSLDKREKICDYINKW